MNIANIDQTTMDKRRAPRWMWITLILSLAINLLVVGVIGGAVYKWRHGGYWGGHGFGGPMSKYIQTLPDERRTEIRKIIRTHFMKMRPLWKAVHKARNKVSTSLKNEPFDKSVFEAALEDLRGAEFRARQTMTPVLSELAATLSAKERLEFLKHQTRHHRWRHNRYDDGAELNESGRDSTSPPQTP